ncbi:MAG: hypothetical protein AAGA60_18255, partial [Cyanobacteria bacterium P01_E01_bin.42]
MKLPKSLEGKLTDWNLRDFKKQLEELEKRWESLEEWKNLFQTLQSSGQIKSIKLKMEVWKQKIDQSNGKLKVLEKEINQSNGDLKALEKEINQSNGDLKIFKHQVGQSEDTLKILKQKIDQSNGKLKVLEKEINQSEDTLKALKKGINQSEDTLKALKQEISQSKSELEVLQKLNVSSWTKVLRLYSVAIQQNLRILVTLLISSYLLDQEVVESKCELKILEQEISQSKKRSKELEEEISRSKRELKVLEESKELDQKIEKLRHKLKELDQKIDKLTQETEDLTRSIKHIEKQLEEPTRELNDLEKQLEESKRELNQLEQNRDFLKQKLPRSQVTKLLKQGKLLLLIDGLDEMRTEGLRKNMQEQIYKVSKNYPINRFILTCRTQVMEINPVSFTFVEIAIFEEEQREKFVQNWFEANGNLKHEAREKSKEISMAAKKYPYLKELMITPVLLSLICLIFRNDGEIPSDRIWLYEKGIKLLLSQWNERKYIEDWEVGTKTYRELELENKEFLLLEIAAHKFKNPKNFVLFEQQEIVKQITHRLGLKNFQEGLGVLRAIETQHGLLIERADELWSFSHLTLQEYFAFKYIDRLSPESLIEELSDPQWQKVVRQLMRSQQPADRLINLIRRAIDKSIQSLVREPEGNQFFRWLIQKSNSIKANYKTPEIRAFYYSCSLFIESSLVRTLNPDLAAALDNNSDTSGLTLDKTLFALLRLATTDLDSRLTDILDQAIKRCNTFNPLSSRSPLNNKLKQLRKELIAANERENREQWWQENRQEWIGKLHQVILKHRNLGHNWQFTYEQKQLLEYYYNANKFLYELLKIEGAVSEDVRREQENTLLLPPNDI